MDEKPLKHLLQLVDLTENGRTTNLIPVQNLEFPLQHEKPHLSPAKEMKDVSDLATRTMKNNYIAMTRAIYLKKCKGFANSTRTWKPQCKDNLVMISCTGATSAHMERATNIIRNLCKDA